MTLPLTFVFRSRMSWLHPSEWVFLEWVFQVPWVNQAASFTQCAKLRSKHVLTLQSYLSLFLIGLAVFALQLKCFATAKSFLPFLWECWNGCHLALEQQLASTIQERDAACQARDAVRQALDANCESPAPFFTGKRKNKEQQMLGRRQ